MTAVIVTELDMKLRPLFMLTCRVADLRTGDTSRHERQIMFVDTRRAPREAESLTFPPFPEQELDTEDKCLSPLKVSSLWEQRKQQFGLSPSQQKAVCLFSTSPEAQKILFAVKLLDCAGGKKHF